ncbi:MAG: DUF3427 domain-containing protein [Gammaproteobacteria bacterium]|nr:DUF3427 domain-containing protein [Gammaproteobacteria bacterium]
MSRALKPGLYENLLTVALQEQIKNLEDQGWEIRYEKTDPALLPELLARHLYDSLRDSLDTIPGQDDNERITNQVNLINQLFKVLISHNRIEENEIITDPKNLLFQVLQGSGFVNNQATTRPTLSMRRTSLLVNGTREPQIAHELRSEIPSADQINLLCAFVRHSGLRLFRDELEKRVQGGARLRVITSVYTGSTERRALDELIEIGAEVKVSYDVSRTRLHAKAWLFSRDSGLHTAYIGSSNLTHTAQIEGLEWNVKVSAIDNPDVIGHFKQTFEQYWQEPEFEEYSPERDRKKLDQALSKQGDGSRARNQLKFLTSLDISPKPHQSIALEALQSERDRGHNRNLIVAATGVGKTFIAGFDFKRLTENSNKGLTLLFVAHRREILEQSQHVFQIVLNKLDFGELLVGGEQPSVGQHVFASIQSLTNRIYTIKPDEFDVLIVDEFHHAAATTYEKLLSHLQPKFLLGLTATPERADGKSILEWFDNRIATEIRLWDALDQGLLCPFHYFGINDQTDLSQVTFTKGGYAVNELSRVFTGDDVRAVRIRDAIRRYITNPDKMTALGFCASVEHAHFMADKFNQFGLRSAALDGTSPSKKRSKTLNKFRNGKLQILFAVDLFNEGFDLPEIDTLLMLRPTESATIFLQQLGRGLRWSKGKRVLTVLDFVGHAHEKYRYDVRYRALLGGSNTRHHIKRTIESDFPLLPPGCAIQLDRLAKEKVLKNIKQAINNNRNLLVQDLQTLGPDTSLSHFIAETGMEIEDIYSRKNSSFFDLCQRAGFSIHSEDKPLANKIGQMIHVNDMERITTWREILQSKQPMQILKLDYRKQRLALMLFSIFRTDQRQSTLETDQIINKIRKSERLKSEILALLDILEDRIRSVADPIDQNGNIPIASHADYSSGEIIASYGRMDKNKSLLQWQAGVLWDKTTKTDMFFITLEKSDKDYSPTTLYHDYPISPKRFIVESQNHSSADTPVGKRYIRQSTDKTNVILFVRERKQDERRLPLPYHCLGKAHYVSHESDKPMKITWELEREMPGWIYQAGKVVAG